MKYFIPEWDDRVDPEFDFVNDRHSPGHTKNPLKNDAYMWDLFGVQNVPFDGVLASRVKILDNKTKFQRIIEEGIHHFLHLPSSFEIMGDFFNDRDLRVFRDATEIRLRSDYNIISDEDLREIIEEARKLSMKMINHISVKYYGKDVF